MCDFIDELLGFHAAVKVLAAYSLYHAGQLK